MAQMQDHNLEQWERLSFVLTDRQQPTVLCITCDNLDIRDRWIEAIDNGYSTKKCFISEDERRFSLFKILENFAIKERITVKNPNLIVHLLGFDAYINKQIFGGIFLSRVNIERELLYRDIYFTIIIWMSPEAEKQFRRHSPDFWNWQNNYFHFINYDLMRELPKAEKIIPNHRKRVFISYSHEDQAAFEKLKAHLKPLEFDAKIDIWYDQKLRPGDHWSSEIRRHLENADVIVLLISAHLLNSDFIYDTEFNYTFKRDREGSAKIIPVIISHADWKPYLGNIQVLPKDGRPISESLNEDKAYAEVASELYKILENKN